MPARLAMQASDSGDATLVQKTTSDHRERRRSREDQIDQLVAVGVGQNPREALSELAKLGARLIIQRAVEDEFDAWLGRARYERRPEAQRGLHNGAPPRRVQTAEGELSAEIPQVREAAEPFVSNLFPRGRVPLHLPASGGIRIWMPRLTTASICFWCQ
jgi:Transposase, Mutator family